MKRQMFCEISPFTYGISVWKNILLRKIKNMLGGVKFAKIKSSHKLPCMVFEHKSVIRRVLSGVDEILQENKAVNLSIAAPKVNGIIIYPGEVFSFWKLVGNCNQKKGYKEGLTISNSTPSSGVGGGMCQFTNLIHWMVMHSPLDIVEHHHHDQYDLFPDYQRKVPFGTGTSISYNYLDYRFANNTDTPFQLIAYVTETHLCGELRSVNPLEIEYRIETENEKFVQEEDGVYRMGEVYRLCIDKISGKVLSRKCIRKNHAKVMYDTSSLEIVNK